MFSQFFTYPSFLFQASQTFYFIELLDYYLFLSTSLFIYLFAVMMTCVASIVRYF